MRSRYRFLIQGMALMVLFLFLTGFEVRKMAAVSLPGTIESVDKDSKSISVKGKKVVVSPETEVVDEKGNPLGLTDLSPKLSVVVEGSQGPDGLSARKIIIKRSGGKTK